MMKTTENVRVDANNLDTIEKRIQHIVEMSGLNPYSFSKKCGFSDTLMRSYISGKSSPGLENAIKMAELGNVSLDWLATGIDAQASAKAFHGLDSELLAKIFESVYENFGFSLTKDKALLSSKIYAYVIKKRNEREKPSKEADSTEITDLIDVLKSVSG